MRCAVLAIAYYNMAASGDIKVFKGQSEASSGHQGSFFLPQHQARYVNESRFLQLVQLAIKIQDCAFCLEFPLITFPFRYTMKSVFHAD